MLMLVIAIVLAFVMLLAIALNKTYHHLPLKELKRQARHGKHPAKVLYRAAAYGVSLQALLFMIIILAAAGSFVLFAIELNAWFAFVLILFLLWLGFLWMPSSRMSSISSFLAMLASPLLAWILRYTHPVFERLSRIIHDHYGNVHTGLYDKHDILELLEWQKEQPDSRIQPDELELAENSLSFGDKLVRDILIPRRMVVSIGSGERVSPVLIDELHKSGHSRFPVYEGKKDHIIGTLYLQDLVAEAKSTKQVSSIMHRDVQYVHEEFSLRQVLQAFFKTHHHLFVVVNSFEEFVGIVTIEDILAQIVGQPLVDEFDRYDDLRAVATAQAEREHKSHKKADIELSEEDLESHTEQTESNVEDGKIDNSSDSG